MLCHKDEQKPLLLLRTHALLQGKIHHVSVE
jgi:hypothetical protein